LSARWIGFIVFMALMMAAFGAMAQGSPLVFELEAGINQTADPNINEVLSYTQAWQYDPLGTLVNIFAHGRFFTAIFALLVGQQNLYAVFPQASPWLWIWLILWVPIIATIVFGIIMLFIAVIQRVFS
jgi:hypothetical protein